jgi:hypothetical protein
MWMLYKTWLHKQEHSAILIIELNLIEGDCIPADAYISLGIPDLKGINDAVTMKITTPLTLWSRIPTRIFLLRTVKFPLKKIPLIILSSTST